MAIHPTPWQERARVFKAPYDEVLAFLKHQDDKIGRVLTALSFLTAAGVALFVFSGGRLAHPLVFDSTHIDVADFFFAVFVTSLLFALLAILGAVDSTTQTPRFIEEASQRSDSATDSILYYGNIYRDRNNWVQIDGDPEALNKRLAESYREDAIELSRRAEHKLNRFADARAGVHLSVVALALLGIARIDGLNVSARWWVIVGVLAGVGLLPGWDFLGHWQLGVGRTRVGARQPSGGAWLFWSAVFLLPALASLVLLIAAQFASHSYPRLEAVGFSLTSLFVSRLTLRYVTFQCRAVLVGWALFAVVVLIVLIAIMW